jgi:hypothetical protein
VWEGLLCTSLSLSLEPPRLHLFFGSLFACLFFFRLFAFPLSLVISLVKTIKSVTKGILIARNRHHHHQHVSFFNRCWCVPFLFVLDARSASFSLSLSLSLCMYNLSHEIGNVSSGRTHSPQSNPSLSLSLSLFPFFFRRCGNVEE